MEQLRILVVDDSAYICDTYAAMFTAWGYHATVAYDGESCLRTALEFRPDVILLDIALPDIDGYALAVALQENPRTAQAAIVALSTTLDHMARCREIGVDDCLIKPVGTDVLQDLLHMHHLLKKCTDKSKKQPSAFLPASRCARPSH